ncbi:MAG: hypothetical protein QOD11_1182, partial [Bradyrhizobium sp.]|nr:hypothetical protein [Bradyrhizobium sp.]
MNLIERGRLVAKLTQHITVIPGRA